MKFRCTQNSIRIRVKKSEIETLAHDSRLEEFIHFGNQVFFRYSLQVSESINNLHASLKDSEITVWIPQSIAKDWINSDMVSITAHQQVSKEEMLQLLIEKDFPCSHKTEEALTDTFYELSKKGK